MRVAVLQHDITWENREANFDRVRRLSKPAKQRGCELLVLPEMFSTGFSMNPSKTAEPADGPTHAFLRDLARENEMAVIGGVVRLDDDGRARNTALVVDAAGDVIAEYTKMHLFSFLGEDTQHRAGDAPVLFTLGDMTLACFICYDLRFPELFRSVCERCHAIFVIASWPASRQRHWDQLLIARAIENQLYIVGANRVGEGGGLSFTGGSVVIDPLGRPLADASDKEQQIFANLSVDAVTETRAALPFLKDRRLACQTIS